MSSIPQNHSYEKVLVDCVQRFLSKYHVDLQPFFAILVD